MRRKPDRPYDGSSDGTFAKFLLTMDQTLPSASDAEEFRIENLSKKILYVSFGSAIIFILRLCFNVNHATFWTVTFFLGVPCCGYWSAMTRNYCLARGFCCFSGLQVCYIVLLLMGITLGTICIPYSTAHGWVVQAGCPDVASWQSFCRSVGGQTFKECIVEVEQVLTPSHPCAYTVLTSFATVFWILGCRLGKQYCDVIRPRSVVQPRPVYPQVEVLIAQPVPVTAVFP